MNKLKNNVNLIGNVGMKPEILTLDDGRKLAKFSLATNESFKNKKGEKVDNTSWHNIVAWNQLATIIENIVNKGDEVVLSGRLTYSFWECDKGIKRNRTEIVCDELLVTHSKNNEEEEE